MFADYPSNPERGCGRRKKGGTYAVLPLGPVGHPPEFFLVCPPQLLQFDPPVQGQRPVWYDQTLHLVDWVGSTYYPNVADFVEEVRRMGLSRRVEPDLLNTVINTPQPDCPTAKVGEALSRSSRLLTVHAHGHIWNIEDYGVPYWTCPKNREGHGFVDAPPAMCAGAFWWDVEGANAVVELAAEPDSDPAPERLVRREMPSFWYPAHSRPDGVEPVYSPAIFAAWSIARFEVVYGEDGEHEGACEVLDTLQLSVPWEVVPE